jgi:hypothetical protein
MNRAMAVVLFPFWLLIVSITAVLLVAGIVAAAIERGFEESFEFIDHKQTIINENIRAYWKGKP